jgi:hypothetical protein
LDLKEVDLRLAAGAGTVVTIVLGVEIGHLHRRIRERIDRLEEIEDGVFRDGHHCDCRSDDYLRGVDD